MEDLQEPYQGKKDQVGSGTRVISEILADTLSELIIWLVFVWKIYGDGRS
jgi:hypothetical protein